MLVKRRKKKIANAQNMCKTRKLLIFQFFYSELLKIHLINNKINANIAATITANVDMRNKHVADADCRKE